MEDNKKLHLFDCCFSEISNNNLRYQSNLFSNKSLDNCELLLFLYRWVESRGRNLNNYPRVVSNLRRMCPALQCCSDTLGSTVNDDIVVNVRLVCDDNILADSFIIYE